jgi:repressor LexA
MRENLSPKQKTVLEYLKRFIRENGYPPSVREICAGVGVMSTSTVQSHLNALENKGFIRRVSSKNRSIEILEPNFYPQGWQEMLHMPILGRVAAGEPIFADENVEDVFPLPLQYFNTNDDYFMLRIAGDSMVEVGINDRDLVVVRKTGTARNGDIVVALVEDEATVKTFYKEKGRFRLQPENKYYNPIIVDDVSILGVVSGLFRVYR